MPDDATGPFYSNYRTTPQTAIPDRVLDLRSTLQCPIAPLPLLSAFSSLPDSMVVVSSPAIILANSSAITSTKSGQALDRSWLHLRE